LPSKDTGLNYLLDRFMGESRSVRVFTCACGKVQASSFRGFKLQSFS